MLRILWISSLSSCFLDEGQENLAFVVNRSLALAGVVVGNHRWWRDVKMEDRRGVAKIWVPQSSTTCFMYCLSFPIHRLCSIKPCIIVVYVITFFIFQKTHSSRLPISWLVFLLFFEILSIRQVPGSTRRLFWSISLGFGWQSAGLLAISVSSVLRPNL